MTSPVSMLLPLTWQSFRDPREAASAALSLGIPRQAILPAGVLVVLLSAILSTLASMMLSPVVELADEAAAVPGFSPVAISLLLGGTLLGYIYGVFHIGRAMGGTGSLPESGLLMVLLQFVILATQVVELGVILVFPGLANFFVLAVAVVALWINANFVAVLHGFSVWKSLGLILIVSVALAFVALILVAVTGTGAEAPA